MVRHPFQPFPLAPKTDDRVPDPKHLRLELPRAELVTAHDIETRLRFENWLWFIANHRRCDLFIANHGIAPVSKR